MSTPTPKEIVVDMIANAIDEEPVAPEGFVIDTEEKAAWAVDKILALEERIVRVQTQFEKNSTRLEKELARSLEYFAPLLEGYFAANPPKKGKTIHLATGDLAMKQTPSGVRVVDENAAIAWAKKNLPHDLALEVAARIESKRAEFEKAEALKLAREQQKKGVGVDGMAHVDGIDCLHITAPKGGK